MAGSLRGNMREIEESEKRYRVLFESAADAIFINGKIWTVDRDYENLRIGMQSLFQHLGIHAALPAA